MKYYIIKILKFIFGYTYLVKSLTEIILTQTKNYTELSDYHIKRITYLHNEIKSLKSLKDANKR